MELHHEMQEENYGNVLFKSRKVGQLPRHSGKISIMHLVFFLFKEGFILKSRAIMDEVLKLMGEVSHPHPNETTS